MERARRDLLLQQKSKMGHFKRYQHEAHRGEHLIQPTGPTSKPRELLKISRQTFIGYYYHNQNEQKQPVGNVLNVRRGIAELEELEVHAGQTRNLSVNKTKPGGSPGPLGSGVRLQERKGSASRSGTISLTER